jgi:uncharacterized protein DUF4019
MKTLNRTTTLICFMILALVSCPKLITGAQFVGQSVKPDPDAVAAGNRWFAQFDAGNYETARHMMAKRVQRGGALHEQQFIAWSRERRSPLGSVVNRQLMWARFTNTLPGAPDGNYEFLHYKTSFQHKASAEEELTLTRESGHWEVSGYHMH